MEGLDLGFPDEEEAIQLGLIVPGASKSKEDSVLQYSQLEHPRLLINKHSIINKTKSLPINSSETSVTSLENYTQMPHINQNMATKGNAPDVLRPLSEILKQHKLNNETHITKKLTAEKNAFV